MLVNPNGSDHLLIQAGYELLLINVGVHAFEILALDTTHAFKLTGTYVGRIELAQAMHDTYRIIDKPDLITAYPLPAR